jgi:hypothetical protein
MKIYVRLAAFISGLSAIVLAGGAGASWRF